MKKNVCTRISVIALIALLMFSLSVTAYASDFSWDMEIGETFSLGFSDTPYVSNDTSVVEIRHEGGVKYTAVAVGKGTAKITGGTWMGHNQDDYIITVYSSKFDRSISKMGGVLILVVILLALVIAEITYIFVSAPKCGMSRLWALVPLFSNVLGLIVFIIVRSNRKTTSTANTIVCPTCNGVHLVGTTTCSICGTRLQ